MNNKSYEFEPLIWGIYICTNPECNTAPGGKRTFDGIPFPDQKIASDVPKIMTCTVCGSVMNLMETKTDTVV